MWALLPAGLFAALAAGIYVVDQITISSLESRVTSLQQEIDNPETGWRRQLSVCVSNSKDQTEALREMSGRVAALGEQTKAVRDGQERLGNRTVAEAERVRDTVASIMSRPVEGPDACARALVIQREPLP